MLGMVLGNIDVLPFELVTRVLIDVVGQSPWFPVEP